MNYHNENVMSILRQEWASSDGDRTLTLVAGDSAAVAAGCLWMCSSLVRSLVGSTAASLAQQSSVLLLPDFSAADLEAAVSVLQSSGELDRIVFSGGAREVLQLLGVSMDRVTQLQEEEEEDGRGESKEAIRNNLIAELVHNKSVEELVCYFCSKAFTGQKMKDKYKSHLSQMHFIDEMKKEIKKYFDKNDKCSDCGKAYVTVNLKRRHLGYNHSYLVDKIHHIISRNGYPDTSETVDENSTSQNHEEEAMETEGPAEESPATKNPPETMKECEDKEDKEDSSESEDEDNIDKEGDKDEGSNTEKLLIENADGEALTVMMMKMWRKMGWMIQNLKSRTSYS